MGTNKEEYKHEHSHLNHKHSDEDYKKLINRMSRIIGHANSVKTMIEEHRDCTELRQKNIGRPYKQMYCRCSWGRTIRRKTKIIRRFKWCDW